MYRLAMAVILSQLAREERLRVVRTLSADSHKTRDLLKSLAGMELSGKILLVDTECDDKLILAARNLIRVRVVAFRHVLPTDLVNADVTVLSERALNHLTELWT